MSRVNRVAALAAIFGLVACGSGGDNNGNNGDPVDRPPAEADPTRDLVRTELSVNIQQRTGVAFIEVAAADSEGLSLEVGDLEIGDVNDQYGPLQYLHDGATLEVGLPRLGENNQIVVTYSFGVQADFEGAFDDGNLTVTWPYYCGNLFPCKSGPDDGLQFSLTLTGVDDDQLAVFPSEIPGDAPSYMLGWAIGPYSYEYLGLTSAGTEVGFYHLPGGLPVAADGTSNMVDVFDWFERELGDYTFGDKVASVSTAWGAGAFGGMEHHPFWHVADGAMGDESTHAHEAAHGWYGNGVRIACWEDFVLSEGTVSYLAARVIEETVGAEQAAAVWDTYASSLAGIASLIAWPEGCNEIDIINDGLFTSAPYMKGAFFYRALGAKIGVEVLDSVLANFYAENVGGAARMQDMLDHILDQTGYDATACADAWLRQSTLPANQETCP